MWKGIVILLLLCFVSCGKDLPEVPETDVPETNLTEMPPQTAPPEELPPLAAHVEEVPPAEILSDGQDDGIDNPVREVIVPEPSFSPAEVAVSRFGDMEMDPERGYYLAEEDMGEIEYSCGITMDFPDSWELTVTTAQDIPRAEAGIYSTKRMEFYSFLYRTPETDRESMDWSESTTPSGQSYRFWEETGSSMDRLGVIWHHCEYPVKVGTELFWFHVYFLTFSDDPAGYFKEYIQPVIDSVTIRVSQ